MAKLEFQGMQSGRDYQTLLQSLTNVEKSQNSYLERLSTLEGQGKISSEQYQKIQQFVQGLQQERLMQTEIMKQHNKKWEEIGHK